MEDEWITMTRASRLTGYKGNTSIRVVARHLGWPCKTEKGTRRKLYRMEDVAAFIESRDILGKHGVVFGRSTLADETAKIVNWADSLERWPTDEEIAAMATDGYDARSVERIIWNRECREDGRWVDGVWVVGEKRRL